MKAPLENLLFLMPYIVSLAISFGLLISAWRHRDTYPASTPFILMVFSETAWIVFYICELVTPTLSGKIFWDNLQWMPFFIIPLSFAAFALIYTDRPLQPYRIPFISSIGLAVSCFLLILTDSYHGLLRPSPQLIPGAPYDALMYGMTPFFGGLLVYAYGITFYGLYILFMYYHQLKTQYRRQVLLILLGGLLPVAITLSTFFGLVPTFHRDSSPIAFALSNLVIAWGLFRYRLLSILPVARATVVEQMRDAAIVVDPDNRIIDLNPAAMKLFCPARQKAIGKPIIEILPQWPLSHFSGESTDTGISEFSFNLDDGLHFFAVQGSTISSSRQTLLGKIFVFHDISERIKLEELLKMHRDKLEELVIQRTEELHAANQKLKQEIAETKRLENQIRQAQKMETIGNLAGGIAHDFNNLLLPVVVMSELLIEDLDQNSLEYENAREILNAGMRGRKLVEQILAFSRQSDHKAIPVRVQYCVKEVIKLCRSTIPSNIKIIQSIQNDCGFVNADPTQLHQIILNLMTNAYHAVEKNGGTITIKLHEAYLAPPESAETVLKEREYVVLTVSDNGCGIKPDVIDKIFDPYFTTKKKNKGTGLGLAVVYGIVKEHAGHITVKSDPGKETTFKVYLPLIPEPVEPVVDEKVIRLEGGTEQILIVDDEESILKPMKLTLDRLGYKVTDRTGSLQAIETFQKNPKSFDLVITDMTMPELKGDQLAKELLAIKPDLPIILCSGFSEKMDKEKMDRMGIKAFLMKPFTKDELVYIVRKVLDGQ